MSDLFVFNLSPLNLIIRGVVVYLVVLLLLRISGKRQMGQLGATEFVAILLISNAVQNSMNGGDNSLIGGLLLAVVLVSLSTLISHLTYRSRRASAIFEGTPTLLVRKGKIIYPHLAQERMTERELKGRLREQGVHEIEEIDSAIFEADGAISVTRRNE